MSRRAGEEPEVEPRPRTEGREGGLDRSAHARALMLRRRCGHCAERVGAGALLRAEPCPHCGRAMEWPVEAAAASVLEALDRRWKRRRVPVYVLLGLSAALTGFLPLVPALLSVGFMVYLRIAILAAPLGWLAPRRRVLTRLALKLWMAAVGGLALGLTTLAALVPFANVVISGLIGLGAGALYVEGALAYLSGRIRREAEAGPALELWEWAVPVALVAAAALSAAGAYVGLRVAWSALAALIG